MTTAISDFELPAAGRSRDILSAFTRSVASIGYEATSFSSIAQELGISKGTIVHHYGTKDRLFAAMHISYMRARLAEAKALRAAFERPAEQLTSILFSFMLYQSIDRDMTVAFQREAATLAHAPALEEGRQLRSDYLSLVRSVMQRGIDAGEFHEVNVDLQSLFIIGGSHWSWTWFHPQGPLPVIEVGAEFVRLMLGSLIVDRADLEQYADPTGPIATRTRALLAASTD